MRARDEFQNYKQEDDFKPKLKIEKARLDLVPPEIMFGMAEAFEDGAAKRSERNWEVGSEAQSWSVRERIAAIVRHALKMMLGQKLDNVSGLHHAAHIADNAAMIYTAYIRGGIGNDDI